MVNGNGQKGLGTASITVFSPLREKIGSRLLINIPEAGLEFSEILKFINNLYDINVEEYLEASQVVILLNGKKLQPVKDYSKVINVGDEILITVVTSGG